VISDDYLIDDLEELVRYEWVYQLWGDVDLGWAETWNRVNDEIAAGKITKAEANSYRTTGGGFDLPLPSCP
jgi:hypothetical protein